MALIKTLILIPIADNTGKAFPRFMINEFDHRLLAAFGGFTATDAVGAWQSEGRIFQDVSRQYVVGLESWWDLSRLLAIVDWAVGYFRQEALYVEVAGVPEVRQSRAP